MHRRHNSVPAAVNGDAIDKDENPAGDGGVSAAILPQPSDIARGSAGDCCILCGKFSLNLPLDHGCKPNIDIQAYRAQLSNALANSDTLLDLLGLEVTP